MKNKFFIKISVIIFIATVLLPFTGNSQDEKKAVPTDTTKKKTEKKYFELSLGHTLLFLSESQLEAIKTQESVIVPTSAILFFAELRPDKKIRIPVFLNLPTENKQFIVDGQLINEKASPVCGAGFQFRIFRFPIGEKSAIEMEMGPLASFILNRSGVIRVVPVAAGRLRFLKTSDFVIYVGSSYSVGINAFGVLFGTGYIF